MSSRRPKQKSAALSALERMRKQKESGRSALEDYKVDDEKIYDELDETDYQVLVRKRQMNEEFVVDDDGTGYVDYGQENWDDGEANYFSSDEEHEDEGNGKTDKKGKHKKEESAKAKGNMDISEMFRKQIQKNQKKNAFQVVEAETKKNAADQIEEDDNLQEMLNELDQETDRVAQKLQQQKMKRSYSSNENNVRNKRPKPVYQRNVHETFDSCHDTHDSFSSGFIEHDPYNVPLEALQEKEEPVQKSEPVEEKSQEDVKPFVATMKIKSTKPASDNAKKVEPKMPVLIKKPAVPKELVIKEGAGDNWFAYQKMQSLSSQESTATNSIGCLDQAADFGSDKANMFYWFDAHEEGRGLYLFGKVFRKIEGQKGTFISCCLNVKNIQRTLYFLPRETIFDENANQETEQEVVVEDLWAELDKIMTKNRIKQWTMGQVIKKYAFEDPEVPQEADWVEVNYSYAADPVLEIKSGRTFQKVLGANQSSLETLIINKKFMGPCWLNLKTIKNAENPKSWCKEEYEVDFNDIVVPSDSDLMDSGNYPEFCKSSPSFSVLSVSLKTIMNPNTNENEIMMISGMLITNVDISNNALQDIKSQKMSCFSCVRQESDNVLLPMGFNDLMKGNNYERNGTFVKRETVKNERGLLSYFNASLNKYDPDILIGHNLIGYDLDVLLTRMKRVLSHTDPGWSRLGRLKRTNFTNQISVVCAGRLLADSYLAARDNVKAKNYSLAHLAKQCLGADKVDLDRNTFCHYYGKAQDLFYLVQYCENDAYLSMHLILYLQFIPLTKQLTQLAGNLWSRTMKGSRAERNEYLLLHEFTERGYLVPDNNKDHFTFGKRNANNKTAKSGKKVEEKSKVLENEAGEPIGPSVEGDDDQKDKNKESYAGGLVLDPKIGLYDNYVVLLDFNSLYPSIIQEYNLCFTTLDRETAELPDSDIPQGVLPHILENLVKRRRQVKQMIKSAKSDAEKDQLNTRQIALKLTANSMYGCLGFQMSRFYCKQLAALITQKGREILQATVDLAENELELNVIYGDTDSIMIYTNTREMNIVKQIGSKLKQAVNKKYRLLEIEMDGCFKKMLLLKKKKYAAITIEEDGKGGYIEKREIKGLDLVRRDWCGLTFDMSNEVLDRILSDERSDEFVNEMSTYLIESASKLKEGKFDLEKFIIRKTLSKNATAYNDTKSMPHVKVALQMMERGELGGKVGDMIPYVMCKEKSISKDENNISEYKSGTFPHHPDDLLHRNEEQLLKIDYEWYLNVQVFPPISRLLCVIEGMDNQRIADCLGIEKKYHSSSTNNNDPMDNFILSSMINDEQKFLYCQRLIFSCQACTQIINIDSPFVKTDEKIGFIPSFKCSHCQVVQSIGYTSQVLVKQIREHIKKYYLNYLVCDDPSCQNKTKQLSIEADVCSKCGSGQNRLEYSDIELYNQLLFYYSLFDYEKYVVKLKDKAEKENAKSIGNAHAKHYLSLKRVVNKYLKLNGRGYVDMRKVFSV